MAVKLGFQVRPGHDPGGVANRYVRFADSSFVELLGITRPDPTFDPGMKEDQLALKGGPGSRSFGFRSPTLDAIHRSLEGLDYAVTPLFTGSDSKKPGWRLFAFDHAPLSSNTFFIDYAANYAPDQIEPAHTDDYRVTREHPNGAGELSAIWLVSGAAESDRRQLEKMGFGGAVPTKLPEVGARGFCVPVGPTALLVLQPDGTGVAGETMAAGGPRVLGVSVGVADLGRAQRWVERGYERRLTTYRGLSGDSFFLLRRGTISACRSSSTRSWRAGHRVPAPAIRNAPGIFLAWHRTKESPSPRSRPSYPIRRSARCCASGARRGV